MNTLLLEVNGVQYSNFDNANVILQLDALAGEFGFAAVSTEKEPLPFKLDDACVVTVNGEKVLTGFIETIDVNYDSRSHSIAISGRSKTADIIDSMINSLELKPPITLKAAIEAVINHIGATISVVDNVGNIEVFNSAEDLLSPAVGENAFAFIEKLARKRQVLLTPDGSGNVVLTQSGVDTAPTGLQNVIGAGENNIETASASYDSTERFSKYVCKSQLNPTTLIFGDVSSRDIVNQKSPEVIDEQVRTSRQLVLQAESASSDQQAEKRIQWEANIRKSRGQVYSTTIPDFGIDGKLWKPNQLVSINDEFAGINAQMLINTVTFLQDASRSSTTLAMVDKDAYTLKLNEPEKGSKKGVGLIPQFN